MNEMTSVATNGSWVTTIMNTSAGSSGARRAQSAARRGRLGGPGGVAEPVPPAPVFSTARVIVVSPFGAVAGSEPRPIALGDVLGQLLAPLQRLVDAHLAGDRRADPLGDLGAEVG